MKKSEIISTLKEILREKCEIKFEVYENTNILEDLKLDSIYLLTMAVEIENHFKIFLDEGDSLPKTVGELADLISNRLNEKSN